MGFLVGGPKCWKTYVVGDVRVALEWVEWGNEGAQCCLVMCPAYNKVRAGAYILPASDMYRYARSDGYATSDLILRGAPLACKTMGMIPSKGTLKNIIDAFLKGIEDLVKMPPQEMFLKELAEKQAAIGDMQLIADGEVLAERDLTLPTETVIERVVH